jgi:hypothetical protein
MQAMAGNVRVKNHVPKSIVRQQQLVPQNVGSLVVDSADEEECSTSSESDTEASAPSSQQAAALANQASAAVAAATTKSMMSAHSAHSRARDVLQVINSNGVPVTMTMPTMAGKRPMNSAFMVESPLSSDRSFNSHSTDAESVESAVLGAAAAAALSSSSSSSSSSTAKPLTGTLNINVHAAMAHHSEHADLDGAFESSYGSKKRRIMQKIEAEATEVPAAARVAASAGDSARSVEYDDSNAAAKSLLGFFAHLQHTN